MSSIIQRYFLIYLTAAFFSVLLSVWICGNETVINPDAICYLQSAATVHKGLIAAMNVCGQAKWPLYSVIIAGFVKITSLSYETAAYIINSFFSLVAVVAFINIVHTLSRHLTEMQRVRLLWLAAAVILLTNEFNSIKHYIVRDHGFWAFYLLSILFLIKFFIYQRWYYALFWGISIVLATLFRIEGAIFLLLMPFVAWTDTSNTYLLRAKRFLQLNILTIVAGILLCIWLFLGPELSMGRLSELKFQLLHGMSMLVENFYLSADNLGKYVLSVHSAKDASLILFLMLMIWYVVGVILNFSVIYTVLAAYAWYKKLIVIEKPVRNVLLGFIILNVIITLAFLFEFMFLSKRYLIALSLVFMIWVPFALENLVHKWSERKWPVIAALSLIFISSLGGIFEFGYSKHYIHDAGAWLDKNTPIDAKIYSNDNIVMYYSHRFGNEVFEKAREFKSDQFIAQGKWKEYEYLALRLNKKSAFMDAEIFKEININPIIVFSNERGDEVRIYRM